MKMTEKFTQIPNSLITAPISDRMKVILIYLIGQDEDEYTFSTSGIAKALNRTPKSMRRYIKQLVEAGVLVYHSDLIMTSCGSIPIYTFNPDKLKSFIEVTVSKIILTLVIRSDMYSRYAGRASQD